MVGGGWTQTEDRWGPLTLESGCLLRLSEVEEGEHGECLEWQEQETGARISAWVKETPNVETTPIYLGRVFFFWLLLFIFSKHNFLGQYSVAWIIMPRNGVVGMTSEERLAPCG